MSKVIEQTKIETINDLILTAGPYIDYREVNYAADAAQNGWNSHHSDYIKKFEQAFADYIGVKYAMVTSCCTGALHLALLAMGIGKGDEVILPETTWIATASAITYVGATPVFADIKPDTWVLDPKSVEKLITPRTKAIMPVHLYGQPVDMDPILELAQKHNLRILEDAAPSVGTIYKGKKTGSFGDMAAFSFQGAKALVSGEGGILVSDNKELIEKAWFYNDHGRDPNRALYNIAIGYKYKMSNIQAALALAQIEKAEEIVEKKRQIFNWYYDRLKDVKEISLNVETPETRNIFWMTSLVLGDEVKYERDEFINLLKERKVDSRPMFYPISSFPMFESVPERNPVAYKVPMRAINLPSGHLRTEEEIDYICAHIRDLLGYDAGKCSKKLQGTMKFKAETLKKIFDFKTQPADKNAVQLNEKNARLIPLIQFDINDTNKIELLAKWRDKAQVWFPSQFKITQEGTKRWLENAVIKTPDRILYMVEADNELIGHVGLFRFNYKDKYCEIDNIVRGEESHKGAMYHACKALVDVAFNTFNLDKLYLRVFSDNEKAINLYTRLGFKEISRMPLRQVIKDGNSQWIEVINEPYTKIERYFVTMQLDK